MPDTKTMQTLAAEIGYSETVFAAPNDSGWRVRYFSPEVEVDFCGHATIALGSALARDFGPGTFHLTLNHAQISVEGYFSEQDWGLHLSLHLLIAAQLVRNYSLKPSLYLASVRQTLIYEFHQR